MTANIIAIGDELLFGQTLDTNSHWIAGQLSLMGIGLQRISLIADKKQDILDALLQASTEAQLVLITGGLGPTTDDLTKGVLAEYFGVETHIHEQALAEVTEFFSSRGKELSETNREQANLPDNCEPLSNPLGTAPGMWFEVEGTVFVSMPGVPYEMKEMMDKQVLPRIQAQFDLPLIVHRYVNTVGIGESFISDKLSDFEAQLPAHIKLAYLPGLGTVKLRLTSNSTDGLDELVDQLDKILGRYVYGHDQLSLEQALGQHLKEKGLSIASAESCTGGYIAHQITSVAGSSDYYKGSIISYANEVKINSLEVDAHTLETQGAVSKEVAQQMVQGVRKKLNTDIGIAVTGIAGPDGGTEEKPLGTVWIAVASADQEFIREFRFGRDREKNIHMTAITALDMARRLLLGTLQDPAS